MVKIQRKPLRFFAGDGLLFKTGFNQAPLRCTAGDKVAKVL